MILFAVALLGHGWLVTRNWTAGFMPGHEFRQTQTALISHYIDQENNFSPLYETPLVGKPWVSILLEVPIYEWSVVGLSRATGWSHVVAARTISLTCFYLFLPAVYLLLGRFGLTPPRRLLCLVPVLACPVYIFYSRAFLVEAMELMCCGWFLYGYLQMMDRRRWTWFLLATVAGTGAALIKGSTLAVWLLPAAAYVVAQLWREWRSRAGAGALAQTVFWGLAGVTVPLGMLHLWIELTDPIKAQHATAWIFTAKDLSTGNWGLENIGARFSAETWGTLLQRWREALMPPWLVGLMLVTGLLAMPKQRWRVAGWAAVFFTAQLLFPFAYALQEYYFYACAVFLGVALGFIMVGLLDTRLPRWLVWALVAVVPVAQLHTYWTVYRDQQVIPVSGDIFYAKALRLHTPKDSVIVISGNDWAAMGPYYAQRRALMILNGHVDDRAYLTRVFSDLGNEDVAALVLAREQRGNTMLRDLAVAMFDLEPTPTFTSPREDIYCNRRYAHLIKDQIRNAGYYHELKIPSPGAPAPYATELTWLNPAAAKSILDGLVSPLPLRVRSEFGLGSFDLNGRRVLNAHPETDFWLKPAVGAQRIEWDFGMLDVAWQRDGDKTDGVECTITSLRRGEAPRVIYRRELTPVARVEDRGLQRLSMVYHPDPGEYLWFRTGPLHGKAFDWTYWAKIEVK